MAPVPLVAREKQNLGQSVRQVGPNGSPRCIYLSAVTDTSDESWGGGGEREERRGRQLGHADYTFNVSRNELHKH